MLTSTKKQRRRYRRWRQRWLRQHRTFIILSDEDTLKIWRSPEDIIDFYIECGLPENRSYWKLFFYMLPSGAACSSRSWLPGQLEGDWQRVDTVTDVAGMWTAARYCKLTMYSRYRWYAFTLQLQVTDAVKAGNTDAVVYSQWFTTCIR